jgi:hypothetical protein
VVLDGAQPLDRGAEELSPGDHPVAVARDAHRGHRIAPDVGQGRLARFEDSFTGVVPATVGVDLSRAFPSRGREDPAGARPLLRHFVAVIDYPDFRNPIVTHLVEPVWKAMLAVTRALVRW